MDLCIHIRSCVCTYVPITHIQYNYFEMSIYIHLFSEDDKTAHYSVIVLGILTCGTAVLLWWLYKECCGSKEKYVVEGKYTFVRTYSNYCMYV